MNPVGSYKRVWNLIPRGIQESRFGNVILNSGTFNHSLMFIHCLTFARNTAIHLATLLRVSVNAECSATAAYKVQSRSNDYLTAVEKFLSSNIQYHLFIFFCLGTGRWVGEGGLFLWETKAKQSRINKNTSEIYTYGPWLSDKLSLSCFQCDTFGQLCAASGLVLLYRSQIPHTERIKHMNIRNSASLSERFFNQVSHFNHWFIWI